ncbi:MAG: phosphate acetyltransferase [Planctomycetota bacterium]
MGVLERIRDRAIALSRTICLPESFDPRVVEAALQVAREGIAQPILLESDGLDRAALEQSGVPVWPIRTHERFEAFAEAHVAKLAAKDVPEDEARRRAASPLVFAAYLIRDGLVDGAVAGSASPTSDVLRAGIGVVGRGDDVRVVSSSFLMVLPDGRALTYADCGVVPQPNAKQLASIAATTARTHRQLTGEEPLVAFLSFSTKGSAEHEDVRKMREAVAWAREKYPDLVCDGELQFDAAFVPSVAERKAPGSPVAGRANVFIFPDLDAGNIAYKITERLAKATALGPLVQGLKRPFLDLSRGCSAEDIVWVVAIASAMTED